MSKKYILSEWPESQEFLGHPDCFLIHIPDENAEQLDAACVIPERLFLEYKCMNKTVIDIENYFSQYQYLEKLIRESIRKYLSKLLINTSEDNPLKCKICLTNEEGLSPLSCLWVSEIWQHPTKGFIYFNFDPDGEDLVEFDNMLLEDLVTICRELDNM